MPRLWRPTIPVEVKCRVVLRQLGEMFIDRVIESNRCRPGNAYLKGIGVPTTRPGLGRLLAESLNRLAELLNCKVEDLRLDHDPALALRQRRGEGKQTVYTPNANDAAHLLYRPHGTQFSGSHDVKTRIRGDRGQYSDIVLIKRERRRQQKTSKGTKTKWQKRKMQSRSQWPPRGSRKIARKK